jgi:hypothetical protein
MGGYGKTGTGRTSDNYWTMAGLKPFFESKEMNFRPNN